MPASASRARAAAPCGRERLAPRRHRHRDVEAAVVGEADGVPRRPVALGLDANVAEQEAVRHLGAAPLRLAAVDVRRLRALVPHGRVDAARHPPVERLERRAHRVVLLAQGGAPRDGPPAPARPRGATHRAHDVDKVGLPERVRRVAAVADELVDEALLREAAAEDELGPRVGVGVQELLEHGAPGELQQRRGGRRRRRRHRRRCRQPRPLRDDQLVPFGSVDGAVGILFGARCVRPNVCARVAPAAAIVKVVVRAVVILQIHVGSVVRRLGTHRVDALRQSGSSPRSRNTTYRTRLPGCTRCSKRRSPTPLPVAFQAVANVSLSEREVWGQGAHSTMWNSR